MREALNTLHRQGLIVIRPQSGSFDFMHSAEDVAALCDFCRVIEPSALRLAHAHRRAHAPAQMHAAIAAMEAAHAGDDALAYTRADVDFHESIVENSANCYLIDACPPRIGARQRAARAQPERLDAAAPTLEHPCTRLSPSPSLSFGPTILNEIIDLARFRSAYGTTFV